MDQKSSHIEKKTFLVSSGPSGSLKRTPKKTYLYEASFLTCLCKKSNCVYKTFHSSRSPPQLWRTNISTLLHVNQLSFKVLDRPPLPIPQSCFQSKQSMRAPTSPSSRLPACTWQRDTHQDPALHGQNQRGYGAGIGQELPVVPTCSIRRAQTK